MKPLQEAYVVAAVRSPVCRAGRGMLAHERPDDLLAAIIRAALARVPALAASEIDDVIAGCAMPEGEQGLNVARVAALLAGLPDCVPGLTINRFCASGLNAIALAADRIRLGEADVILAGGVESMSLVPMGGNKPSFSPALFARDTTLQMAYGMGLTAEKVAQKWQISREAQDEYALQSHQRALAAQATGAFATEIASICITHRQPDLRQGHVGLVEQRIEQDEGPRADTSLAALAALKPAFVRTGTVTAGNSSQMSDGAAMLVLMSEQRMRQLNLQPLARFVAFAVRGVAPALMGIGPTLAIPAALQQAGLTLGDMAWIELNEAFAAQTLAVAHELQLDMARVNPLGGAIALGHPLGATGAIRAATLIHGLQRSGQAGTYGMVTMCIGMGMGAAGIFHVF